MAQPPRRILVTGGCGFVGARIVHRLLQPGIYGETIPEVAIITRRPRDKNPHAAYYAADIGNEGQIKEIFDKVKPHIVIHAASPAPLDATEQQSTNITGTAILLQVSSACAQTRAFIYTSSESACIPTKDIITEQEVKLYDRQNFRSLYGMSKAVGDAMTLAANSKDLKTLSLRIPGVYGPGDPNMILQLYQSLRNGEHRMQIGNNSNYFEFCFIDNVVEAHLLAMNALLDTDAKPRVPAVKVDGEAFFVIDGTSRKFFDMARDCYAAAGSPVAASEIRIIPLWFMQSLASTLEWAFFLFTCGRKRPKLSRQNMDHLSGGAHWSIEKARERLGYEPVISQAEAIVRSMEWAKVNL